MAHTMSGTIDWKRIGNCRYEATVRGVKHRLSKSDGYWYVYSSVPEDERTFPSEQWRVVPPIEGKGHIQIDFGTRLVQAKRNAMLVLIDGLDAESSFWED